jgi:diguanylate cyclase (GGDEF)-like protein/PAS domain S-box-containing protein
MDENSSYYTILDALPDHIFVFSETGIYVDVFGGDENATGFDCKPFIGKTLHDIAPVDMAEMFLSFISQALAENATQKVKYKFAEEEMIDLPADIPHPQEIWFEGIIKPLPMFYKNQRTVLWVAKNVTQQHVLEQKLKTLSEIDELTQVPNRRTISLSLKAAINEYHQFERPFSLIMFDIDNFKRVNDTLGHPIGDEVIKHVAKIAKSELRSSDSIGRFGGEEFLIILRDSDIDSAWRVGEKIRRKIQQQACSFDKYDVHVTVSLGITTVLPEDTHSRNILSRADMAMYYSKAHGRNQTIRYSAEVERADSENSKYDWLTPKPNLK